VLEGGAAVSLSGDSVVDLEVALELARRAFPHETESVVYVDRELRAPPVLTLGSEAVSIDKPVLVVFRDELPGANWMHPCTYALVDPVSGEVVATRASDRPPHFGLLPSSWVVAADPEGRADLVPPPHATDLQGGRT
jgi:hypothetical protein